MAMTEVRIEAQDFSRFEDTLGVEQMKRFRETALLAREAFAGRTIWNVNSTARGGGVAEMLQVILAYARGAGIDARWMVMDADPEFFRITKRLHNGFHGAAGDGGDLGERERGHYEQVTGQASGELLAHTRPGDVVILHDPQTAGMVAQLEGTGRHLVWRSHICYDDGDELSRRSGDFVRPYLDAADAFVFSRASYVPPWLEDRIVEIIAPSIDPFSAKNQELSDEVVRSILVGTGLLGDGDAALTPPVFRRRDGSPGRVDRFADILRTGPPTPIDAPLIVQVSRWDDLKDMQGVMTAFAEQVDPVHGAHLLLAGPNVTSVTDDPEGADVLAECQTLFRSLSQEARSRIAVACLPMSDLEENAAIVNAIQRHASIAVQKSLAEGFGLTVAEAMWKARPMVASNVGGIGDQIEHGTSGILLRDPRDAQEFGDAINSLLEDPDTAACLGVAARERVRQRFLSDRHLEQYATLIGRLI